MVSYQPVESRSFPRRLAVTTIVWMVAAAWPLTAAADPVWTDIFDGEANGEDVAADSVANDDGEVYVTGRSDRRKHESDLFVIKYGPDGERLWTARADSEESGYDASLGIAHDSQNGGVVVTGLVGGYYHAEGDKSDEEIERAAGSDGSVESDFGVAKFSSDGELEWMTRTDGAGSNDAATSVTIHDGAVYMVGQSNDSDENVALAVGKFDLATGDEEWLFRDGENEIDPSANSTFELGDPGAVSLDSHLVAPAPDGDVYVTGMVGGPNDEADATLMRFAPDGSVAWRRNYDVGGTYDAAYSLATDGDDNAFIGGESLAENGEMEAFVLKISPSNELLWERSISTGGGFRGDDDTMPAATLADIDVDTEGDVYFMGYHRNGGDTSNEDTLTHRLDGETGETVWKDTYDKGIVEQGTAIEVTDDAAYVVAGSFGVHGFEYLTMKYDASNGDRAWFRHWNSEDTGGGAADTLSTMPDGGVTVSGALGRKNEALTFDIGTVQYAADEPNEKGGGIGGGCGSCLGTVASASDEASSAFVFVFFGLMFAGLRVHTRRMV